MATGIRLTDEEIDKRLESQNRAIKRIGHVKTGKTKIEWECQKINCGHIWLCSPSEILGKNQTGCPKCSKRIRLTDEEIDIKLSTRNIKRLDSIIGKNNKSPLNWQCLKCGHIWKTSSGPILNRGSGCPYCIKHVRLTDDLIDLRLSENNRDIKRKGNFKGCFEKIEWECKKFNHLWLATPNSVINTKSGCPKCNSSKGENFIQIILNKIGVRYEFQKSFPGCKNIFELKFDFYLPDFNCCIEFDGRDHFPPSEKLMKMWPKRYNLETYKKVKSRDTIKNNYCLKHKIKLIRISYLDRDNAEEILKRELNINSPA